MIRNDWTFPENNNYVFGTYGPSAMFSLGGKGANDSWDYMQRTIILILEHTLGKESGHFFHFQGNYRVLQ